MGSLFYTQRSELSGSLLRRNPANTKTIKSNNNNNNNKRPTSVGWHETTKKSTQLTSLCVSSLQFTNLNGIHLFGSGTHYIFCVQMEKAWKLTSNARKSNSITSYVPNLQQYAGRWLCISICLLCWFQVAVNSGHDFSKKNIGEIFQWCGVHLPRPLTAQQG